MEKSIINLIFLKKTSNNLKIVYDTSICRVDIMINSVEKLEEVLSNP